MRKMKKMAALCMAGMMALSLAACSGGAKETTAAAPAETQAETAARLQQKKKPRKPHQELPQVLFLRKNLQNRSMVRSLKISSKTEN